MQNQYLLRIKTEFKPPQETENTKEKKTIKMKLHNRVKVNPICYFLQCIEDQREQRNAEKILLISTCQKEGSKQENKPLLPS